MVGRRSRFRLPRPSWPSTGSPTWSGRRAGARGGAVAARASPIEARSSWSGGPGARRRPTPRSRTKVGRAARRPDLAARPGGRSSGGCIVGGSAGWRRRAAGPGVLNVVFALLWTVRGTRPVDHWLALRRPPAHSASRPWWRTGPGRPGPGGAAGLPPVWVATLVVLLATHGRPAGPGPCRPGRSSPCCSACGCCSSTGTSGSARPGVSRLFIGVAAVGLVVAGAAGVGAVFVRHHPQRHQRGLPRSWWPWWSSCWSSPAQPRVAADRRRPARGVRAGPGHHRPARRRHARLLRPARRQVLVVHRESLVAYSVINGVMLVSPDPIGPPSERAEAWSDAMDLAETNGWYLWCWPPPRRGCPSTGRPGWSSTTSATRRSSTAGLLPQGQVDEVAAGRLQPVSRRPAAGSSLPVGGSAERGAAGAAAGAHDRDAPGRGRARLLDDPQPDLRPPRHGPAAGRLLRTRRQPAGVQPVRPGSQVNGYSLDLMRRTNDPRRPERADRLRDHRDDPVDGRTRPPRPGPQLRHHAGRGGRGGRRRTVDVARAVGPPPLQRHACRSSRCGISTRSTTRCGTRASWSPGPTCRWPGADWPSPGPRRSPNSRSSARCCGRTSRPTPTRAATGRPAERTATRDVAGPPDTVAAGAGTQARSRERTWSDRTCRHPPPDARVVRTAGGNVIPTSWPEAVGACRRSVRASWLSPPTPGAIRRPPSSPCSGRSPCSSSPTSAARSGSGSGAYRGLTATGMVLITLGTRCPRHPAAAVVGMGVAGFVILFAGSVRPRRAWGPPPHC